jgi:hypothetical protein
MSSFQQIISLELDCVTAELSYKQASNVEFKNSKWYELFHK